MDFSSSSYFFGDFSGGFAVFGSCYSDFSGFSYFFMDFSGCFAVVRELFWGFQQFQLLFYSFFPEFFQLLGWMGELF
nr:hypothetical protein [uncultured Agathobacter sp.]